MSKTSNLNFASNFRFTFSQHRLFPLRSFRFYMGILSRAVDWVVTRTVSDENLYEATTGVSDSDISSWESIPGDIFSVILNSLNSKADGQCIRDLRLVCKTWRRHVETRLPKLSITLSSTSNALPLLKNFTSIHELQLSCTYNAVLDPRPLLVSVKGLTQLKKLDLRNCKGRLNSHINFLSGMNQLQELCIDGESFISMRQSNVTISNLNILCLQNCESFSSVEYFFLTTFSQIQSLKCINASSFWTYGREFLHFLNNLQELAVINYNNRIVKPSFSCLKEVPDLKKLVVQETEVTLGQIQDFPHFQTLKQLSLYGCSEISSSLFNSLAYKCPVLSHMKIGCIMDTTVEEEFTTRILDMPYLERVEIINCPSLKAAGLGACFKHDLTLIHKPLPDSVSFPFSHFVSLLIAQLLLEKSKTLNFNMLENFLRECQEHEISGLPLFGEYFDPAVLTELSGRARFDLVRLLVSYGADVDYGNPILAHNSGHCYDCSTPLHFAVHKGDIKGVVDLLDLGARVNAHCSEDCRVPLHLASSAGHLELTRILVAAGANVNALDSLFRTPLHAAVSWGSKAVIADLIDHGADGSLVDHELLSPMCYAARSADIDLLKFLIEAGLGINDGIKYDLPTPLHVAVKRGKHKMVKFLLESGAKPEAKDVSGSSTPLFVAARHGHRSLLAMLLKSIESNTEMLNARDETGNTLLHYSATFGWMDIVELLIEMGANVNTTDPKGFTALYYADMQRHMKVVSRLTREGGLARWITHPRIYRRQHRFENTRAAVL